MGGLHDVVPTYVNYLGYFLLIINFAYSPFQLYKGHIQKTAKHTKNQTFKTLSNTIDYSFKVI